MLSRPIYFVKFLNYPTSGIKIIFGAMLPILLNNPPSKVPKRMQLMFS